MFVSKPYNYEFIKSKKLNMPSYVDRKFDNISKKNEGLCVLIFVKDHTLTSYSIVPRTSVADFSFIDISNHGLPSNTQFKIVSDSIFQRKVVLPFD